MMFSLCLCFGLSFSGLFLLAGCLENAFLFLALLAFRLVALMVGLLPSHFIFSFRSRFGRLRCHFRDGAQQPYILTNEPRPNPAMQLTAPACHISCLRTRHASLPL